MNLHLRKTLLRITLAGGLVLGAGAAPVLAQNSYEPPPGTRADQREDRHEMRRLQWQTRDDEGRLQSDIYQFGKHSPEVRADQHALHHDNQQVKRLARDMQRDRQIREGDGWR